jgi:hypothetical protein
MCGACGDRQYDVDDLIALIQEIPFNKISIPVYAAKSIVFNDETKRGTVQVGYIRGFNVTEEGDFVFDTTIYAKNAEAIKAMSYPIVYPKVRVTEEGEIQLIVSLEIIEDDVDDAE